MYLTTKSGRKVLLSTPEEEAQINAGIAADPDAREWTEEDFKTATPFAALPAELQAKLRKLQGQRGPQKAPRKISTTIRLSPEVVEYFRAGGDGWQSRLDTVLKDWVKTHSVA